MFLVVAFGHGGRRSPRTESSVSNSANWFGLSETNRLHHGSSARTASTAALIPIAVIFRQHAAIPALSTSRTKIAAVRGEKNKAKSIIPQRSALTAAVLSSLT